MYDYYTSKWSNCAVAAVDLTSMHAWRGSKPNMAKKTLINGGTNGCIASSLFSKEKKTIIVVYRLL